MEEVARIVLDYVQDIKIALKKFQTFLKLRMGGVFYVNEELIIFIYFFSSSYLQNFY